jgi:tetratricopeptide (TPR) repeat protein
MVDPDAAEAQNKLGMALSERGELDEAIAAYREAIRLRPDFPFAHLNLGMALYGRGEVDEAIAAWREPIRLQPDYAQAHYNLGSALHKQGKLDEAIAAWRQAARLEANANNENADFILSDSIDPFRDVAQNDAVLVGETIGRKVLLLVPRYYGGGQ